MAKDARLNYLMSTSSYPCSSSNKNILASTTIHTNLMMKIEEMENLKFNNSTYDYVSQEILESAAKFFSYLIYCPSEKFRSLKSFFNDLFKQSSIKTIILSMSSMIKTQNIAEKASFLIIWNKLSDLLNLENNKIVGRNMNTIINKTEKGRERINKT